MESENSTIGGEPMPLRRNRISRGLHVVGDLTSKAGFSAAVAAGVGCFLVALAFAGFPASWEAGFATGAAAVTLVMVFVIQHTQSRQQLATQLKLDELIRSSPQADDLLVHIETAHDAELLERERGEIDHHTSLRDDPAVAVGAGSSTRPSSGEHDQ